MATSDIPSEGTAVEQLPLTLSELRPRAVEIAWIVVKPLASLRLTVILFALAIFLVWVGTLAQVDKGMWEVMEDYFTSWIALIQFQVFFPRSWFPDPKWQDIRGAFPFPGGASIG